MELRESIPRGIMLNISYFGGEKGQRTNGMEHVLGWRIDHKGTQSMNILSGHQSLETKIVEEGMWGERVAFSVTSLSCVH
jgi:hypothetical protein